MDVRTLSIELAEKMGLLATAALVAVLAPPLRGLLLGVHGRRNRAAAGVLGFLLSLWGAKLGLHWLDENINVRGIGILIAAVLGGWRAGGAAGLLGGIFYVVRVEPDDAPWGIVASAMDGLLAGWLMERRPELFGGGFRTFLSACAIQGVHVLVIAFGLLLTGQAAQQVPAWPAHLIKLVANAAGISFFVVVARIVIARQEAAVALVEARAAAESAALEALRRRLEPHFLFNALNTLRATIRTDPRSARELVADLADLYRYLLTHPEDAPLTDEVNHACSYLAIERARLGDDRVTVETRIDPEVAHARVPALLLQPLVENAVKHGVGAREGPGTIVLQGARDGSDLHISVEDRSTGPPRAPVERGSGIALETLRRRLHQRFRGAASLELHTVPDGMRASVRLPWRQVAPEDPATTQPGRTAA
ncbi:MAG: sensor histidine kinase [Myxococcota bacterium]